MSVSLPNTGQTLTASISAPSFPCWQRAIISSVSISDGSLVLQLGTSGMGAYFGLVTDAGGTVYATVFTSWGGASGAITGYTGGVILLVWASNSSVTVYHAGNTGGQTLSLSNPNASELSGVNQIVCGDSRTTRFASVWAEVFIGSGSPDATQRTALLTTSQKVEDIASLTVLNGWALNPPGAAGAAVSSPLPTITGGATIAATAGVVVASSAHPVDRTGGSFGAGATLARTTAAGSLTAVASAFTAGATLARTTAGGSLGPVPGVITSQALTTNNGSILASVALDYVDVYLEASGVFVGRFTGLSTNGAGVFTVTSGLLTPGTAYKLDWRASGGQRRMPVATAA